MNKKLVRDGFESYLEIESMGGEEYEYQMLMVNDIASVLPVNVMTVNQTRKLIYSASGYKTLEKCFEKTLVSAEQMLFLMESVLDGIDSTKKYLLTPNNLVLSPDCLFVDADYKRAGLVYVPGYERDIIIQMRELLEHLIGKINQSDIKNVMLSWKLYVLLKDDHISLREIRKTLGTYKEKIEIPDILPEIREDRRESRIGRADKKKAERKKEYVNIVLLICVLCALILIGSELLLLYFIYTSGILVWKRNLLLLNTALLIICLFASVSLWKKEKVLQVLRALQNKRKE